MRIRTFASLTFSVIAIGVLGAQTNTKIKHVPVSRTSAASGKEMFSQYCAACHGLEGKGDGPAAAALKKQPANLTQLAMKNGGSFPELRVMQILSGKEVLAHGSEEMPVWGGLLKSVGGNGRDFVELRLVNLTSHVKSLQAK
jgi:mono/diheme cytochrome c family protein